MAPGDESNLIEAVVTCEGNLHDPDFSERFQILLGNLKTLLREDELVKVKKIEPWNSVRVTISIPKEAAQKLKQLAEQGSHVLKSLGILTVQVDGDQVISLTIAGQNNQPTELILRQDHHNGASSSQFPLLQSSSASSTSSSSYPMAPSGPQIPLGSLSPSPTSSAFIRSPNVVAPAGESIPNLPPKSTPGFNPHSTRPPSFSVGLGGPFPFASMAHAAQTMQRTDHPINSSTSTTAGGSPSSLPLTPTTATTQTITNSTSVSVSNVNNNNTYVNHHYAVNSTNNPNSATPTVSSPSPASSTASSSNTDSLSSSINNPNQGTVPTTFSSMFPQLSSSSNISVGNASAVNTPAVLQQQQQVGGFKSEQQLNRFGQLTGVGGTGSSPSLTNHLPTTSQSLQQLQNVNAPPPYPGVNSGSGSNNSNINLNSSSSTSSANGGSGLLQGVNQQKPQLNLNSSSVVETSSPRSFFGAPPRPTRPSHPSTATSGSNVSLVRSVSSPAMTSTTLQNHQNLNSNPTSFITEGSSFKDFLSSSQYQQPMSSPLLVNLLQNSEALGASSGQGQHHQQQGMAMFPPGSSLEHKKLILAQHMQQRKAKRGLSLEGASTFGDMLTGSGKSGPMSMSELVAKPSSTGVGGTTADQASSSSGTLAQSQNNQLEQTNNSSLTQITLPSSSSLISSIPESSQTPTPISVRMNVPPISVGQPRPSSDLSTTAKIIQGRTIIHQGSTKVFNPGQIRAIRLNQTNPPTSAIPMLQGKSGIEQGGEELVEGGPGAVQLNGPSTYNINISSPSPMHQSTAAHSPLHLHQPSTTLFSSSVAVPPTPTSSAATSSMSIGSESGMIKIDHPAENTSVVYSSDQSSRTFMDNLNMNLNADPSSSSMTASSLNTNISHHHSTTSINNTVIPPLEPTNVPFPSNINTSMTNHTRLSTSKSFQERQAAFSAVQVQSQPHEAKLFPSQHQQLQQFFLQQQQKGLKLKPSNKPSTITSGGKPRQLLINPLTGVMEPSPSGSSSDSGEDDKGPSKKKGKGGSRKTLGHGRGSAAAGLGRIQHRQIVTTTTTGVTVARVLKSVGGETVGGANDSHCKAVAEERKQQQLQNRLTVVPVTVYSSASCSPFSNVSTGRKSSRDEGEVELGLATITSKDSNHVQPHHRHHSGGGLGMEQFKRGPSGEKIKLRLKLEKNEPISPAYKVDVSFVKKSEKGSLQNPPPATATLTPSGASSSTSGTLSNLPASTSSSGPHPHVNNPSLSSDQPRVPPLHISLRGKNAAVVVSSPRREDDVASSPTNFIDGGSKPALSSSGSLSLGKGGSGGKRTKNRVKSIGIESDPEQPRHLKTLKLARPRLSKDSTSVISLSELDGFGMDSLKSRLLDLPTSSTTPLFGEKPLTIAAGSSTSSNSNVSAKDLILSENRSTTPGPSGPIPSPPTGKLKTVSGRRVSDSELLIDHQQQTSLAIRSLESCENPLIDSSLLFQQLSKKEDSLSPLPVVSSLVKANAQTTLSSSGVTHVSMSTAATASLSSTATTSVLTLTSSATGATISTAKGISVTDVVRITAVPPTPIINSTITTVSEIVTSIQNDFLPDEAIPSPLTLAAVPKLIRENIPKPLDISGAISSAAVMHNATTPTSKSPNKPLPDLLALLDVSIPSPLETTKVNNPPSLTPLTFAPTPPPSSDIIATPNTAVISPTLTSKAVAHLSSTVPVLEKTILKPKDDEVVKTSVQPTISSLTSANPKNSPSSEFVAALATTPAESSSNIALVIQSPAKLLPSTTNPSSYSMPKLRSPVLRPKKQTPKVSIGTSIDSELQSLTPSPSLRELLEKERERNLLLSVKDELSFPKNSTDMNKMVASKLDEIASKSSSELANHTDVLPQLHPKVSNLTPAPFEELTIKSCPTTNFKTGSTSLPPRGVNLKLEEDKPMLMAQSLSDNESVKKGETLADELQGKMATDVVRTVPTGDEHKAFPPLSTVTPNAPLPFPLVVPKGGEDQTGIPGEDSGIDSMGTDALSEKSPNQGESPARKEIEQFGESGHHSLHSVSSTTPSASAASVPTSSKADSELKAIPSTVENISYTSTDTISHSERLDFTIPKGGHHIPTANNATLEQNGEVVTTSHELQHVPVLPPHSNTSGIETKMELDEDKSPTTVAEVTQPQLKLEDVVAQPIEQNVTEKAEGLKQKTGLPIKTGAQELDVPNSMKGGPNLAVEFEQQSSIVIENQQVEEAPQGFATISTVVSDQMEKKLPVEEQPSKLPINEIGSSQNLQTLPTNQNFSVDAIRELNQKTPQPIPKPSIVHNAKFRRAKLENIVAAIGTKNIERQQAKTDTDPESCDTLDSSHAMDTFPAEHLTASNASFLKSLEISEAATESGPPRPAHLKEIPFHKNIPVDVISSKSQDSVELATISSTTVAVNPKQQEHTSSITRSSHNHPKTIPEETFTASTSASSQKVLETNMSLPPILETEESQYPPTITPAVYDDNTNVKEISTSMADSATLGQETPSHLLSSSLPPSLDRPDSVEAHLPKPPPISVATGLPSRPHSPEKPVLEPQTSPTLISMARPKVNRRGQDKPPKLSKATETDPRPECANPPQLEVGETSHITQAQILTQKLDDTNVKGAVVPIISCTDVSPPEILKVPSSLIQSAPETQVIMTPPPQSIPNVIQLSKAIPIPANTGTLSAQTHSTIQSSSITTLSGSGQAVFALHPNVNLQSNLCHQLQGPHTQGQPSITGILPGGQKIPVKLVTIPKTSSSQFQTIPLSGLSTQRRGSPNILEAVNIIANSSAGSRSNSPKTIAGNNALLQTTGIGGGPINLSTISLPGGGNIQLVPISLASTVGGSSSNPVKVLVSQPVKLNQSLPHHNMIMKSVMMGQATASTTIRVMRPAAEGGGIQDIEVVAANPELLQTLQNSTATLSVPTAKTFAELNNPTMTKTSPSETILDQDGKPDESNTTTNVASYAKKATPSPAPIVTKIPPSSKTVDLPSPAESSSSQKSTHKRVDDLEVLEPEFNQINDDDLPLEADIIHDLKDLEDVLAGENIEAQENGIDSPYDFTIEEKLPEKYQGGLRKQHQQQDKDSSLQLSNKVPVKKPKVEPPPASSSDVNSLPDSPIPVIRSSSPLYTYGNRSSSKTSRSPSPAESSDIHGEDQEIIDSFTRSSRSPSQPKLSPQNNPRSDDLEEDEMGGDHHHHRSPNKPDLISAFEDRDPLNQLSIEIPPVDLLAEHQTHMATEEQRKPTRSTRSNTRLVSPDITAFRSDTPKPVKFSTKPDPLSLRNSPKPSPTGSLKMLSPTVSSGLTLTPSSSNRSSPISLAGSNASGSMHSNNAHSVTSAALEKISGHLTLTNNTGKGGNSQKATISKRKRQESDSSSNTSKDENNEEKIEIDLNSRPGKRRCSENAAELIKACIGVEDTPKRNSMLIKRMEESNKLKEAKLKKAMAVLVEEKEDDAESVESVLSRGRGGRSSRASSEDRSSSRGSSVQRIIGSSSKTSKEDELPNHEQKTSKPDSRAGKDTTTNQNSTRKKDNSSKQTSNSSAANAKRVGNRTLTTSAKEKSSPLTPAKTRTNVRKDVGNTSDKPSSQGCLTGGQIPSQAHHQSAPETENSRRKTRSTATSRRYGEASDSELAALKRRRISKDTKS